MRTVVVKFWGSDPPREVGRVEYSGVGSATVTGFDGPTRAQLENGINDLSGGEAPEWRTPSDGNAFLDAVLFEFRGGYTRAEELT